MRKIKFENLQSKFFIILMILSLVCLIIGTFEIIEFENPITNKILRCIGFFSQVLFYSRMFWFKNYVQWNKKGLVIRINSFWGKSIAFEDIKDTRLENNVLTIYKNNGESYDFDLKDIDENDSKRLNHLILEY
jgi:hypothetical protein